MYQSDFDVIISYDNQNIKIMRNNELITELDGPAAIDLRRKLVKIQDIRDIGFEFKSLEYDGVLTQWYELVLVEPSNRAEGVSLMYHPERDIFEYPEGAMFFSEMSKVESFIKSFKNE